MLLEPHSYRVVLLELKSRQVSLAKPMGIAFVENDSGSGVYIDEVPGYFVQEE